MTAEITYITTAAEEIAMQNHEAARAELTEVERAEMTLSAWMTLTHELVQFRPEVLAHVRATEAGYRQSFSSATLRCLNRVTAMRSQVENFVNRGRK